MFDDNNKPIKQCPLTAITPLANEMLNLYSLCGKYQCLPKSGGVLDQPSKLIKIFTIFANVEYECMKEEQSKSK